MANETTEQLIKKMMSADTKTMECTVKKKFSDYPDMAEIAVGIFRTGWWAGISDHQTHLIKSLGKPKIKEHVAGKSDLSSEHGTGRVGKEGKKGNAGSGNRRGKNKAGR